MFLPETTPIILGLPWLRNINPDIDWRDLTMKFPRPGACLTTVHLHLQPTNNPSEAETTNAPTAPPDNSGKPPPPRHALGAPLAFFLNISYNMFSEGIAKELPPHQSVTTRYRPPGLSPGPRTPTFSKPPPRPPRAWTATWTTSLAITARQRHQPPPPAASPAITAYHHLSPPQPPPLAASLSHHSHDRHISAKSRLSHRP
ncbi:hypothetical protein C0993_003274 [Termitomyces sp. T159_Od127]|nr:hypothetical protein C0993_003274 [Termitomyces sp. T159_Od127]